MDRMGKKILLTLLLLAVLGALGCLLLSEAALLPTGQIFMPTLPRAEIELIGDEEIRIECGESFEDPGATAWLNRGGERVQTLQPTVSGQVDTARPGSYELIYTADYEGKNAISVSRRVIVQDTTPPLLELTAMKNGRDYQATDTADGDLNDRVERVEEDDRIVYTVRDSSGNETSVVRMKAPVLELEGGDDVEVAADYRFVDPGFHAEDRYGNDLTEQVEVEGELTPWVPGEYCLSYTVTDDEGFSTNVMRVVHIVPAQMPDVIFKDKVIYLTFDDGPAASTERLLDMLAKYDAKVTFFVTNTDPRYVDMIGRAYREGHSIGLHGYVHDASKLYASEESYFHYFDLMQELIYEQTGEYTRIVRFIGGSSNTSSLHFNKGLMTRLTQDLGVMGYRYYDWNMQPENADADVKRSVQYLIGLSTSICEAGEAVPIGLQHDTGGWNVEVTEQVIKWGLEHGYTFEGITITTPEVHHRLRN